MKGDGTRIQVGRRLAQQSSNRTSQRDPEKHSIDVILSISHEVSQALKTSEGVTYLIDRDISKVWKSESVSRCRVVFV